jgi:hypothetical protein
VLQFGNRSINVWTLTSDGTEHWSINVHHSFLKNDTKAGDIQKFRIIGEEIVNGISEKDMIVNLVVQIVSCKDRGSKEHFVLYYLYRISINFETQKYIDFTPGQLSEPMGYAYTEESVKCLVVTNEGNMTYVFLCYPDHTLCYNVFSDHIEENDIDVRIIGHGIILDKVRNFLLFADRDIIIFSLLREQSLNSLMKFYLKEIEANCKQRQKIQEANLDSILVRTKDEDEKKVFDMIRSVQDVHGGIHPYKMDLQAMIKSHSEESFNDIIMNVIKRLIEDPIRDSMV